MEELEITFGPITKENIIHLRQINEASFPIQYNEKFYNNVINETNNELNKYAYYNNTVVGAICSRIEILPTPTPATPTTATSTTTSTNTGNTTTTTDAIVSATTIDDADVLSTSRQVDNNRLYIMTLAVLAPYRGRKIGSQLIQSILNYCINHNTSIKQIALHVQISNHDAIRFYCDSQFGFIQGDMVQNYYKRIQPPHCYLLYKNINPETEEEL